MISPRRVGVIAVVCAIAFSMLGIKLWFLQVAEGNQNRALAQDNEVDTILTEAPRGEIRDRAGKLLAGSRASQALVVDRFQLTTQEEQTLVERLSVVLETDAASLTDRLVAAGRGQRVTIAVDVPDTVAFQIQEYPEDWKAVEVRPVPVRTYPNGPVASHVIGYVGKPSDRDLESIDYLKPGDTVGKAGIESYYDQVLRGSEGFELIRVNSRRQRLELLEERAAVSGQTAYLTIDLDLQVKVEEFVSAGVAISRSLGEQPSGKAAAIVMDANDCSLLAMASTPDYDPAAFVGGITTAEYAQIESQQALLNLAIQGEFAPASTFKVVPYAMAMQERLFPEGASSPFDSLDLPAQLEFQLGDDSQQVYRDWTYPVAQGMTNLRGALAKSADVYFWKLALEVWREWRGTAREALVQDWARKLSYGAETGVDLPFEHEGVVPDRDWLREANANFPEAYPRRNWLGGDLMNLVIGQGDLLATPLQVAVSYAALVNGGTVCRPRVLDRMEGAGAQVSTNPPQVTRQLELYPETTAFIREDLHRVVAGADGTARATFSGFGEDLAQIGGKTGTAEVGRAGEEVATAWFVGVAPIDAPRWVVVVVIDRGGGGSKVAAPVAKSILQHLLRGVADAVVPGGEGE